MDLSAKINFFILEIFENHVKQQWNMLIQINSYLMDKDEGTM